MAKPRGKGIYPYPVYVAYFRGGEHVRMSFWHPLGKSWSAEVGKRVVCQAIGNERARNGQSAPSVVYYISYRFLSGPLTCAHPPADDLIFGYVEHNGKPMQGTMLVAPELIARLAARDPRVAALALERKAA